MSILHPIFSSKVNQSGDIVFVHGLDGHPFETWGFDNDTWIKWLKEDRSDLNLWTLEYDCVSTKWMGDAMSLPDRGANVLACLDAMDLGQRPICFITHSMGGLVVKQLLRHAASLTKEYKHIVNATCGVVFLSTPHNGSDVALIINYLKFLFRTTVAVEDLEAHQPRLLELNQWYRNNVEEIGVKTKVFFEKEKTKGIFVVNATSADPGILDVMPIPVDKNHHSISCPYSNKDLVYTQTIKFINKCMVSRSLLGQLSIEEKTSELRQKLFTQNQPTALKKLLYETESLLEESPNNPDIRHLISEIKNAIAATQQTTMGNVIRYFPSTQIKESNLRRILRLLVTRNWLIFLFIFLLILLFVFILN